MNESMLSWLRSQIESDRATAEAAMSPRKARRAVDGEWVEEEVPEPGVWSLPDDWDAVMSQSEGCLGVVSGSCGCCAPDSEGRREDLAHIALHDPRDTIARCEMELALLDEMIPILEELNYYALNEGQGVYHPRRRPPEVMRDETAPHIYLVHVIASGYRHRPGYDPAWAVTE